MIFALSDVLYQAIIAAVVTTLLAWMNLRAMKEARRDAMLKDEKLNDIAKTADATYSFQNHAMGLQKKALAVASRALSEGRPENAVLREAADIAEKDYADHMEGQARVDAQMLITAAELKARELIMERDKTESEATKREQERYMPERDEP